MLRALSRENAAMDSIIPRVLSRGTRDYPDMESISAAFDELYGAVAEPIARQRGELLCTGFVASFVNDAYLPTGADTMENTLKLVAKLLLEPVEENGVFKADYVSSEKEILCDDIRSCVNDKRSYAVRRLKENMCANENYGAYAYGSVESVEKITPETLWEYYKKWLSESEIFMFFCGNADENEVERVIKSAFANLPRGGSYQRPKTEIVTSVNEPKYITEEMDVIQGNLAIGFRLGEMMKAPKYAVINMLDTIFGSGVNSKLFMNVREKLSLCYYASSSADLTKGVMIVTSGIESAKYSAALDEILAQLEECKNGSISQKEFDAAKSYLTAALRAYSDSARMLDEFYFAEELRGTHLTLDEYINNICAVTVDEVSKAAASVKLDTVYFLKDREGEPNNGAD